MKTNTVPTVLTISDSDPYGASGIQVDAKVIHALGGYAFSVTTAIMAKNSIVCKEFLATPVEHFKAQLHTILDDIEVDAVKIGMLANEDIIKVVAEAIKKYKLKNVILDTVLFDENGKDMLTSSDIKSMERELFPLVDLIITGIDEINIFLDRDHRGKENDMAAISQEMFALGAKSVLVKAGYCEEKQENRDYLIVPKMFPVVFSSTKLQTTHTHGIGSVLTSAIAIGLAKNEPAALAIQNAKDYLYKKLHTSAMIKFNYKNVYATRKEPLL